MLLSQTRKEKNAAREAHIWNFSVLSMRISKYNKKVILHLSTGVVVYITPLFSPPQSGVTETHGYCLGKSENFSPPFWFRWRLSYVNRHCALVEFVALIVFRAWKTMQDSPTVCYSPTLELEHSSNPSLLDLKAWECCKWGWIARFGGNLRHTCWGEAQAASLWGMDCTFGNIWLLRK